MTEDAREAGHSPLPWEADKWGNIEAPDEISPSGYQHYVRVGTIGAYHDQEIAPFNKDRWDADAALIVRAVNCHALFVEAAQAFAAYADAMERGDDLKAMPSYAEMAGKLRAALSKATDEVKP